MKVRFFTDPSAFITEAGSYLAADPLHCSILATTAEQHIRNSRMDEGPFWFATIRDDEQLIAVAMRTHPAPPHAAYVVAMPEQAARALADGLAEREELLTACNGDAATARLVCERLADRSGAEVRVSMHTRLFELTDVAWPARPAGRLRAATSTDLDLVEEWVTAFHHDSQVQAGRDPSSQDARPMLSRDRLSQVLADRKYWLWEVGGRVVHLTGVNQPAYGVARIGPVYTPAPERGKGYAAYAVATLSQRILDQGHRPCLYTDQANPVSNKVYERIGYRRVSDSANYELVPRTGQER